MFDATAMPCGGERCALLTREFEHRMKNSLQLAASMLHRYERRAGCDEARDVLQAAAARLVAMGAWHAAELTSGRRLADRLDALAAALAPEHIPITVHVDTATDGRLAEHDERLLTLIASELVINAIKHGVGSRREGLVDVRLAMIGPDMMGLVVTDDGEGVLDTIRKGAGSDILERLCKPLRAILRIENRDAGGCMATVAIPVGAQPGAQPGAQHAPP